MQLLLGEHEQFSQRATLFDSTPFFLASEITVFRSSQLSLPGRLVLILLKSPLKNTNFSPTYADDLHSNQEAQTLFRGNVASSITTELSNFDIHLTFYYKPSLLNLQDYRMLGEHSPQFPINDQLKFQIESALRYDSDPHLELLPLDFSTVIGIVYSIAN